MMTTWTFKTLPLWLFACVLLGGCATRPSAPLEPTPEQLASADYGEPLPEEEAKAKAEQWLLDVLKDPESARIEWEQFERGWGRNQRRGEGRFLYGYVLLGKVNARNSYGGYTGAKQYKFLFRDGEIAGVWQEHTTRRMGITLNYMRQIW